MGVCMRRKLKEDGSEGDLEGVRLPFFDYSKKEVVSIKKWNKVVQDKISRVKKLTNGRKGGWITGHRTNKNLLYKFDHVSCLKNCGKEKTKMLVNAGITQVCELASLGSTKEIKQISKETHLPTSIIRRFHKQAVASHHGSAPGEINYLTTPNPYKSRYGEDWEAKIKDVSRMKKYCCITELVTHMNNAAKEAFQGTKYQETYLFYHNALTSMCNKDCHQWMEERDILKHWVLPELGLNNEAITENEDCEIIKSKRYAHRLVGDCAEAMPLDNSLFRDLRTSLDIHVTLTSLLPKDDPRRFSKGTLKK